MADRFELVALALPSDCAPESLPACIAEFIAVCWNGMSPAQLLNRARRPALRASLRALTEPDIAGPEGVRRHVLVLVAQDTQVVLVAQVRRVECRRGARRAKVSLPPAGDARQGDFSSRCCSWSSQ